jgi:hypothetical protein
MIMKQFYTFIKPLDFKEFAATENMWRTSIPKIKQLLKPIQEKLKDSLPSVDEDEIE